jgi:hypothetical protein
MNAAATKAPAVCAKPLVGIFSMTNAVGMAKNAINPRPRLRPNIERFGNCQSIKSKSATKLDWRKRCNEIGMPIPVTIWPAKALRPIFINPKMQTAATRPPTTCTTHTLRGFRKPVCASGGRVRSAEGGANGLDVFMRGRISRAAGWKTMKDRAGSRTACRHTRRDRPFADAPGRSNRPALRPALPY